VKYASSVTKLNARNRSGSEVLAILELDSFSTVPTLTRMPQADITCIRVRPAACVGKEVSRLIWRLGSQIHFASFSTRCRV
jgi:hypothetical protein